MMNIARIFPYSAIVDVLDIFRIFRSLTISAIASTSLMTKLLSRSLCSSCVGL